VSWLLVTFFAIEARIEMGLASFNGKNPWTLSKRGIMADMLPVAAGQISHPITHVILMEPDNRLIHAYSGHNGIGIKGLG